MSESLAEVSMAQRDAVWFDHPDVRTPKVYHVVTFPMMAACDTVRTPLMAETEVPLAEVAVGMRCRRAGCRKRWESA